jgi:ribokinase
MTPETRVCVLGSINMDLVVRAPRFAQPGETVLDGEYQTFPGGKGANQAIAAARTGARATLIGCVGDDAYGRELVACMGECKIDISHVQTRAQTHTGVGVITIDRASGENMIIVASGANMEVTPEQIQSAASHIEGADVLLLQREVPMEANLHAARTASAAGTTVMFNAAPAGEIPRELFDLTEVLVVNRAEAAMLARRPDDAAPIELLDGLEHFGVRRVVVTLGAEGAVTRADGDQFRLDALAIDPVDTVGAGDAFVGTLSAAVAEGRAWTEALALASAAGGLAATKQGAIASLPHRVDVEQRAASIRVDRISR